MIVMWHKFIYRDLARQKSVKLTSSLVVAGENSKHTAMSKTVGLPLAIAAKLVLTGKLNLIGMYIPTHKNIYEPVLTELKKYGIIFSEKVNEEVPEYC